MRDGEGRSIHYLRLSVIDRCDLRCRYCMAEEPNFLPKDQVLSLEELACLADLFMDLGVRKIRLTGGEPLVRRNVLWLVRRLSESVQAGRLEELTLTTNGMTLVRYVDDLAASAIRRINVSLDSLKPDVFRQITRRGELKHVMDGVLAARQAGLAVKINMVALKGLNDGEFDAMIAWCGRYGLDLTLIETMPMGAFAEEMGRHYLPLSEVRAALSRRWSLTETDYASGGPAGYVRVEETGRRLGFITPISHGFCDGCNRVRLSCTGQMVSCLGGVEGTDLRAVLRDGDKTTVNTQILRAVMGKMGGHHFGDVGVLGQSSYRPMHHVGG